MTQDYRLLFLCTVRKVTDAEIKKIVFKYPLQFCQKKAHCIKKIKNKQTKTKIYFTSMKGYVN